MKLNIFLILALLTHIIVAQEKFNRVYADPSDDLLGATAILELNNGVYLSIGQRTNTTGRGVALYKINKYGDVIAYKEHFFSTECLYTAKAIKRENDFLVIGNRITNCDDINDDLSTDIALMSFDFDLNLNWIKSYGGPFFDAGRDILQNPDGTLMLCGTKSTTSDNIEDFYLIKTDADGNVLWENTYGGANKDLAYSISSNFENGYLLSGYSNSFSSSYDLLLYNLDLDGNILWQKSIGGSSTDYAGKATKLYDKTYIIDKNESDQLGSIRKAKLIKINANGSTIWTKEFTNINGYASIDFTRPIELIDGSIVFTGVFFNNAQNPIAKILKLDPMGSIIWQRDYFVREDRSQYIYDIKSTSDNGLVFTGFAYDSITPNRQRFWVAKLDCFGCDGVLCDSSAVSCDVYDCTGKDFEALISSTSLSIDLQNNQAVVFSNNATQTSNREWLLPDTTFYTAGTVSYTFNTPGTYPVTLINYHGACSDTSVVMVEVYNSLGFGKTPTSATFSIVPNPNSGSFLIKTNEEIENIELIDLFGKVQEISYFPETKDSYQVQTAVANGTYFIRIKTKNYELVEKIGVLR